MTAAPGLTRGPGWVLCVVCWETHRAPWPGLYRDDAGQLWDVCKGQCAVDAGLALGPRRGPAS